jgi:hypothetical protein
MSGRGKGRGGRSRS